MTSFARKVLSGLPDTNLQATTNNYTLAAGVHCGLRQGGRQGGCPGDAEPLAVRAVRLPQSHDRRSAEHSVAIRRRRQRRTSTPATGSSSSASTWAPTGRSLLEARFGYSWTQAGKNPPALGSDSAFDQFGLAGLPTDSRDCRRSADAAHHAAIRISDARRPIRSGSTRPFTTRRSTTRGRRERTRSRPDTSSSESARRCRTSTRCTAATPTTESVHASDGRRREQHL